MVILFKKIKNKVIISENMFRALTSIASFLFFELGFQDYVIVLL